MACGMGSWSALAWSSLSLQVECYKDTTAATPLAPHGRLAQNGYRRRGLGHDGPPGSRGNEDGVASAWRGCLLFGRALVMRLVRELKIDRAGKLRQRRKHRGAEAFDLRRGGVVVRDHENGHACCRRGADAVEGVFHGAAFVRGDIQAFGGGEVNVRGGLGMRDVLVENGRIESGAQAKVVKAEQRAVAFTGGCQGALESALVHGIDGLSRPGLEFQLVNPGIAVDLVAACEEAVGKRGIAELIVDHGVGGFHREAHECVQDALGNLDAQVRRGGAPGGLAYALGIDEGSVHVEDDGLHVRPFGMARVVRYVLSAA